MVGYWGARACNALSLHTRDVGVYWVTCNVRVSWNTGECVCDHQENFANSKKCQLY